MENLKAVELVDPSLSQQSLQQSLPSLSSLSIIRCPALSTVKPAATTNGHDKLEYLRLNICAIVPVAQQEQQAAFPALQTLCIEGTYEGREKVPWALSCPSLSYLDLRQISWIDEAWLASLQSVGTLWLSRMPWMERLPDCVATLPNLKILDVHRGNAGLEKNKIDEWLSFATAIDASTTSYYPSLEKLWVPEGTDTESLPPHLKQKTRVWYTFESMA